MKDIGNKIRQYRKENNLSQEALAEKVDVNKNFIYKLESDQKSLSLQLAIKMANALNISLDELFADELTHEHTNYFSLFEDCSYAEKEILIKILQEIKTVLHGYTIK
ncbi:helix-turn-helix domain-containing protein [Anaerovibrio lipolyticus]|uniref:helix-turn-helix domain-containing protein n=1 Tax=Anaerovibrio lipolyticus TaxID=82374 RepID=UPI000485550F|nr:helix-turn-helix transcriptional regulator [Anaerovibrio lipolyticus]MBE6105340.1 helix-turn-helix transcriptional regulator [Anaerovibrio lipolyticus]